MTEILTAEGKLYLCVIKDCYDGVVIAWQTGPRQTADLVIQTVERAVASRLHGERPILHSDHGSQYTSSAYRECLNRHGMKISMGKVKTCADNSSAETVFSQLKREMVYRSQFRTRQEATVKINQYFLHIYNPLRRLGSKNEALSEILRRVEEEQQQEENEEEFFTSSVP